MNHNPTPEEVQDAKLGIEARRHELAEAKEAADAAFERLQLRAPGG